jgi:hypothetical protein
MTNDFAGAAGSMTNDSVFCHLSFVIEAATPRSHAGTAGVISS